MNRNSKGSEDHTPGLAIERELESIKKLLILLLIKAGASQDEIGGVLGVDRSSISRMFSRTKIKKFDGTK